MTTRKLRRMIPADKKVAAATRGALLRIELQQKAKSSLDGLEDAVRSSQRSIGFALAVAFGAGVEYLKGVQATEGYEP